MAFFLKDFNLFSLEGIQHQQQYHSAYKSNDDLTEETSEVEIQEGEDPAADEGSNHSYDQIAQQTERVLHHLVR